MNVAFDPLQGLVVVPAELTGPSGSVIVRLALDTGATGTLVNVALLVSIGCDPALVPERVQVTTGSGIEFAPRVYLDQIIALGEVKTGFAVLAHTLPPNTGVDGLLGLDFLRGRVLTIDFNAGVASLAS